MRFIKKSGLLLILAAVMLATSCKKDDAPDPTEKVQLDKLSGTWSVTSAELDGTNRDDFSTMKLVISGTFNSSSPEGPYQYVVNGTRPNPSPWPASGSWIFGDGEAAKSIIIRDAGTSDEVQMTYSTDGTTLTVSFNVTGSGWAGSARTEQVEGDWVFEFTLD